MGLVQASVCFSFAVIAPVGYRIHRDFYGVDIDPRQTAVAESGYSMDSKLWGGIVKWGYP